MPGKKYVDNPVAENNYEIFNLFFLSQDAINYSAKLAGGIEGKMRLHVPIQAVSLSGPRFCARQQSIY